MGLSFATVLLMAGTMSTSHRGRTRRCLRRFLLCCHSSSISFLWWVKTNRALPDGSKPRASRSRDSHRVLSVIEVRTCSLADEAAHENEP